MTRTVLDKIRAIVGDKNFTETDEDKIAYSYDGTPLLHGLPEAVVFPESDQQISQLVLLANAEHFAIVPRGAGSGLSGGAIPVPNNIVLVMTKWNKILEIDPVNRTALVEPGVVTATLQSAVEKFGLMYPPDPGSAAVCTIGGNVAENAGGLRGLKYGVTKNYVLGIEMVLPDGSLLKTGGKNMKDVAGYNLRDFVVGSEGTLGIFTKILVKLIPLPKNSTTIIGYFDSVSAAGDAILALLAAPVTPSMLEFLDAVTIKCIEEYMHLGLPANASAMLLLEVDGREQEVREDAALIQAILKKYNAFGIREASRKHDADLLKSARRSAFSALARVKPTTILEDATVPRGELPKMLENITVASNQFNVLFGNFGHAGDGNLHPTCLTDERDSMALKRAHQAFAFIYNEAIKLGGTITGEHGVGLAKKHFLESLSGIPAIELMKRIKETVDPNNVINPGKIFTLSPRCEGRLPDTMHR
jgi:glycolate oxidase